MSANLQRDIQALQKKSKLLARAETALREAKDRTKPPNNHSSSALCKRAAQWRYSESNSFLSRTRINVAGFVHLIKHTRLAECELIERCPEVQDDAVSWLEAVSSLDDYWTTVYLAIRKEEPQWAHLLILEVSRHEFGILACSTMCSTGVDVDQMSTIISRVPDLVTESDTYAQERVVGSRTTQCIRMSLDNAFSDADLWIKLPRIDAIILSGEFQIPYTVHPDPAAGSSSQPPSGMDLDQFQ